MFDLDDDIRGVASDEDGMTDAEIKRRAIRQFGKARVEEMTIDEMIQELD